MTHDLLAAYDAELREEAETRSADHVDRDGPLLLSRFAVRRGFVTYRRLDGYTEPADGSRLDALIERTIRYYRDRTDVDGFEWKTRGHDDPADLGARLTAHGLVAQERETVMIGAVAGLAGPPPPEGVAVRRVGFARDGAPLPFEQVVDEVRRMQAMQAEVFDTATLMVPEPLARELTDEPDRVEAWVAEADGEVVGAGRLVLVPGTRFAGLWGGSVVEEFRGRGIYRSLVSARAQSAIAGGVRYLYSDSTDFSRPILERSGMVPVTTTTPYLWSRQA